jgi:hypothetical protein
MQSGSEGERRQERGLSTSGFHAVCDTVPRIYSAGPGGRTRVTREPASLEGPYPANLTRIGPASPAPPESRFTR